MNTIISIRDASPADIPDLIAWNAAMARETEDKPLDLATLEAGVNGLFADPERGFYLIAERDGQPLGGLLVTFEWSDWRNGMFWWIQSVFVTPDARRQGVFRALYAEVEARARENSAVGLRLYVELENTRAQATYETLGMQRCRYHLYESLFS